MKKRILTQAQCDRLRRLCDVHTMTDAGALVGVDRRTVRKIRDRGWKAAAYPRRARPSDFALHADEMTLAELCKHYSASLPAVRRWSEEIGRKRMPPLKRTPPRAIPDDLASVVAQLGPYGAAAHYGVSYGTVKRWRKARGLPFSWSRQPGAKRGRKPAPPSQIGWADRYYQENANAR